MLIISIRRAVIEIVLVTRKAENLDVDRRVTAKIFLLDHSLRMFNNISLPTAEQKYIPKNQLGRLYKKKNHQIEYVESSRCEINRSKIGKII